MYYISSYVQVYVNSGFETATARSIWNSWTTFYFHCELISVMCISNLIWDRVHLLNLIFPIQFYLTLLFLFFSIFSVLCGKSRCRTKIFQLIAMSIYFTEFSSEKLVLSPCSCWLGKKCIPLGCTSIHLKERRHRHRTEKGLFWRLLLKWKSKKKKEYVSKQFYKGHWKVMNTYSVKA